LLIKGLLTLMKDLLERSSRSCRAAHKSLSGCDLWKSRRAEFGALKGSKRELIRGPLGHRCLAAGRLAVSQGATESVPPISSARYRMMRRRAAVAFPQLHAHALRS